MIAHSPSATGKRKMKATMSSSAQSRKRIVAQSSPLPFNSELAPKQGHFIDNIVYYEKTYAIACRHHTMKLGTHPWCWKCYRFSDYEPCLPTVEPIVRSTSCRAKRLFYQLSSKSFVLPAVEPNVCSTSCRAKRSFYQLSSQSFVLPTVEPNVHSTNCRASRQSGP